MDKLSVPSGKADIVDKLNEIIDWLNGNIGSKRIKDIQVGGTQITLEYLDGSTESVSTRDTQYVMATINNNGLMLDTMVALLSKLEIQLNDVETIISLKQENAVLKDQLNNSSGSGGSNTDCGGEGGGNDCSSDCDCDCDCNCDCEGCGGDSGNE